MPLHTWCSYAPMPHHVADPSSGGCGKGPNVVVVERHAEGGQGTSGRPPPILVGHVSTPNDAAQILREVCGVSVSAADIDATQVRL